MTAALVYFGVSAAVLLGLWFLYVVEDIKGTRVLLPQLREHLDRLVVIVLRLSVSTYQVVRQRIVQLILHYGVRRFLNSAVAYLRNLERRVEHAVLYNRQVARKPKKKDRNHLDEIADHKESVALTEEERERYRSH